MRKRKSKFVTHKSFIFISLMILGGFSWYLVYTDRTTTEKATVESGEWSYDQNPKETYYPVPYSDSRITANAIVTDPRFARVARKDGTSQIANVLSGLPIYRSKKASERPEKGTWLWTPILQITPAYRNSIVSGAKKNGIENIYVSIDTYLDIFVMPDGPEKETKKKEFGDILEGFISEARRNGMTVDAEGGWRNWAEPENTYKAFAILDYAIEFNLTRKEKFRGFQYDVEPYLLDSYKRNKTAVLTDFLDLINDTVGEMKDSDLELSVVIPEFYDGTNDETPEFTYAGQKNYALEHLLRVLEQRPGSSILVMSYRNFSTGYDGSIDITQGEIDRANKYQTKIIVAQETGDINPPYVTFHNTTKSYLNKQIGIIQKTFAKEKSFGGVAIHYVNAFLDLR